MSQQLELIDEVLHHAMQTARASGVRKKAIDAHNAFVLLTEKCRKSLEWLVADARWRFDETKGNLDDGSEGGYSEELKAAIELLKELQQ